MHKKVLYFDTETTGLDPIKNDIVQLSGIIEINGKIEDSFDIKMQPFNYENISQDAINVHGMTIDEIKNFDKPSVAFIKFQCLLETYVDKFNKKDKFYPAGYNVKFDIDFVNEWFKKCGSKYGFGPYQNWKILDPIYIMRMYDYIEHIELTSLKLETVCAFFGIKIQAHDAMSDIKATRELLKILSKKLTTGQGE